VQPGLEKLYSKNRAHPGLQRLANLGSDSEIQVETEIRPQEKEKRNHVENQKKGLHCVLLQHVGLLECT
jgi:hypothetical protein